MTRRKCQSRTACYCVARPMTERARVQSPAKPVVAMHVRPRLVTMVSDPGVCVSVVREAPSDTTTSFRLEGLVRVRGLSLQP